jgi:hypothetical protein
MGIGRHYRIELAAGNEHSLRIYVRRSGYQWRWKRATWMLQHVRAPRGILRVVLTRNRQPLAALQSQGRLLNRWTEFVYDGRGYRLFPAKGQTSQRTLDQRASDQRISTTRGASQCVPARYVLQDQTQENLLTVEPGTPLRAKLDRALPLPLLVAVLMQTIDQEPLKTTRKEEQR